MTNFKFLFLLLVINLSAQNTEWINLNNSDMITKILDDGNTLWVGTNGGLVNFNKETADFINYNRANANLPDNHIRELAIDSSGFLWIGTQYSGVGRFDGNICQVYNTHNSNLPYNQWNISIDIDSKGNIYLGSLWYFSKYDGNNWQSYETGNPLLAYLAIHDIKFDKNDIGWLGASWGLGKYENGSLIQKYNNFETPILTLEIDKGNNIWIGTDGNGIHKFDGQNFTIFNTTNSGIPGNIIFDMEFDQKGNIWLSTENGIAKFNDTTWQIYNSENSGLPENDFVMCIEIDKNNVKWFGTRENGLFRFDGINWKKYSLSNSTLSNSIYSIAIDGKQNVWVSGVNMGLAKYDREKWYLYDKFLAGVNEILLNKNTIYEIAQDPQENIWLGLKISPWLLKYDGNSWTNYDSTNSPFTKNLVNCITFYKGDMWIGSYKGLLKFDGTKWTIYNRENSPLTSNNIMDIKIDKTGNLWLAMGFTTESDDTSPTLKPYFGGLVKYDKVNWTIYDTSNSDIPFNDVSVLEIDNENNIWLSCWEPGVNNGFGLTKFDGINWSTYTTQNSPIPSNKINDITLDSNDNLWLCTSGCSDCGNKGGLVKYDRKNSWTIYNQENSGIAFDEQTTVEIDSFNNKWIGHLWSGLSIFREGGIVSQIKNKTNMFPRTFHLYQNYPNPFNPVTKIKYSIPTPLNSPFEKLGNIGGGFTTLKVYDILGREVTTLVNQNQKPGNYEVEFNTKNISSGVYFYTLNYNNFFETKKMVLLR